ncbi:MAG: GHKL domain-containing protein [Clostridiales bacterium]|nr:GHKL domain-containing protein [Clostridiales bacterium]
MIVNLFLSLVFMEQSSGIFSLDNGLIHYLIFSSVFLIMSCFVVYFFIQICLFFQKEKEFYITNITNKALHQQIEIQNVMVDNIKKIKHDMRNNLINISMLINQGKNDEVINYINELTANIQQSRSNICRSGNSIVDAIINCKVTFCESNNIRLNLKADKLPELNTSFSEMTTMLSNVLDNSIEASLKLDEAEREIDVHIFIYKNYAVFSVINKFNSELNTENGVIKTTKLNKSIHGYGLSLIEDTVTKNNGIFNYSYDNNLFKVTVMLPLKIQNEMKISS